MSKQKNINWYWIIGIAVLVVVGVGIYFWLSGDSSSIIPSFGNSIPQPPALPS